MNLGNMTIRRSKPFIVGNKELTLCDPSDAGTTLAIDRLGQQYQGLFLTNLGQATWSVTMTPIVGSKPEPTTNSHKLLECCKSAFQSVLYWLNISWTIVILAYQLQYIETIKYIYYSFCRPAGYKLQWNLRKVEFVLPTSCSLQLFRITGAIHLVSLHNKTPVRARCLLWKSGETSDVKSRNTTIQTRVTLPDEL